MAADPKIIFLDIDGTLTPPGGYEPPESALRAIRTAREQGHKVFMCTGRNYGMIEPLLGFGFDGAITSCGGYIFAGDYVLQDLPLTDDQMDRVRTLFGGGGAFLEIEAKDTSYMEAGPEVFIDDPGRNGDLRRMIKAVWVDLGPRPIDEYDGRPVYKLVFVCTDPDKLARAKAELGDELEFVVHDFSEEDCIFGEAVSRKFNKGSAVRHVTEALGYDIADTIGFGDSMLDMEMIEAVGTSVCMGNGSQRLQELSDIVCPAVEEDGIAWAFQKLGLV